VDGWRDYSFAALSERLTMQETLGYGEGVSDACLRCGYVVGDALVNKQCGPLSLGGPVYRSAQRGRYLSLCALSTSPSGAAMLHPVLDSANEARYSPPDHILDRKVRPDLPLKAIHNRLRSHSPRRTRIRLLTQSTSTSFRSSVGLVRGRAKRTDFVDVNTDRFVVLAEDDARDVIGCVFGTDMRV
jgi:hypothetical protein